MSILAADKINLSSGWTTFWEGISGSLGGLPTLMTAIGALLVVGAIGKWMWEKRRGGGGGGGGGGGKSEGIIWALALGAMLAAPNLLIPIFLKTLDIVANGIVAVYNNAAGGQ
jgi:hypothetical protein